MLRLILALPFIVVLVIFALSNRELVTLDFLGYQTATALSVAILIASAVFFLLGAMIVWFGELKQRRRARRAEQRVRTLEGQIAGTVPLPATAATTRTTRAVAVEDRGSTLQALPAP